MSRKSNNSNPFEDDDYSYSKGYSSGGARDFDEAESRYDRIMRQQQESRLRTKDSTTRALRSVNESEQIGIATAEELLHQGEQLDNVERKTEEIHQSLTVSQRHLNHVKSIFGGIKNWFSKKEEQPPEPKQPERTSRLKNTVEEQRSAGSHPGLRIRDVDTSGFGEDNVDHGRQSQPLGVKIGDDPYEDDIDDFMGEISSGVSRLKGLAVGLGDEIEVQNAQIGRISSNVDRDNIHIEGQNTQMRKILR